MESDDLLLFTAGAATEAAAAALRATQEVSERQQRATIIYAFEALLVGGAEDALCCDNLRCNQTTFAAL